MQRTLEDKMTDFGYKDLTVLYEDNHIIVVVKPQNVPSQADESGDPDMLSVVKEYIKNKYDKPGNVYVGLVHRLDRPTGGLMVFARTSKAAERLCDAIKNGDFEKTYLCVTCGEPKPLNGHLTHYLKKNEKTNTVAIVPMMTEGAKKAELEYSVLQTLNDFSLVKVSLITGRSHQIRAQMAFNGTPLFADAKYGADKRTLKHNLALWSTVLRFTHPTTGERLAYIAYPLEDVSPWKAFELGRYLNFAAITDPYGNKKNYIDYAKTEE